MRAGDRVGVFPPNGSRFVVALLAVLRLGAVHVPVNPMFRAAELRHELNDAAPELVITRRPAAGPYDVRDDTPVRTVPADADWPDAVAYARHEDIADDPDALAALQLHRRHHRTAQGLRTPSATWSHGHRHRQRPDARPDETARGIVSSATCPSSGSPARTRHPRPARLRRHQRPCSPAGTPAVLRAIETHRVSTMAGTVENYLELLDHPDFARHDLTSLTAPLTVSFIPQAHPRPARQVEGGRRRPQRSCAEASYGMTETQPPATPTRSASRTATTTRSATVFCGLGTAPTSWPSTSHRRTRRRLGERGEIVVRALRASLLPLAGARRHRELCCATAGCTPATSALDEEWLVLHHYPAAAQRYDQASRDERLPTECRESLPSPSTRTCSPPRAVVAAAEQTRSADSGRPRSCGCRPARLSPAMTTCVPGRSASMAPCVAPGVVEILDALPPHTGKIIRKTELTALEQSHRARAVNSSGPPLKQQVRRGERRRPPAPPPYGQRDGAHARRAPRRRPAPRPPGSTQWRRSPTSRRRGRLQEHASGALAVADLVSADTRGEGEEEAGAGQDRLRSRPPTKPDATDHRQGPPRAAAHTKQAHLREDVRRSGPAPGSGCSGLVEAARDRGLDAVPPLPDPEGLQGWRCRRTSRDRPR